MDQVSRYMKSVPMAQVGCYMKSVPMAEFSCYTKSVAMDPFSRYMQLLFHFLHTLLQYRLHIHYTKKLYPFCVGDIWYMYMHSIYELHKKLRILNILNFLRSVSSPSLASSQSMLDAACWSNPIFTTIFSLCMINRLYYVQYSCCISK